MGESSDPIGDTEERQALGAVLADIVGQLVDHLAAVGLGGTPRVEASDPATRFDRVLEHAESAGPGDLADIDQFHPEPQIGLVRAETFHDIGVSEPGQGQSQFLAADFLDQVSHQPVDDLEDVVALDKGHLDVDLGELGLPVGSQVLVPEAAGHLHVAVVAGDHQDLLVDLGTLRQGEKAAGVHSAGDQVVASSLGSAPAQHRGLDFQEVRAGRNSRVPPWSSGAAARGFAAAHPGGDPGNGTSAAVPRWATRRWSVRTAASCSC